MLIIQNKSSGVSNVFSFPGESRESACIGVRTEFFPESPLLLLRSSAVLPPHLADYLPD